MKKKILYISHLDWDSIKVRVQDIAVEIAREYDVTVLHQFARNRKNIVGNDHNGIKLKRLYGVPKRFENLFMWKLNAFIMKMYISILMLKISPDLIYFTSPGLFDYIPASYKKLLAFDCMDDMALFYAPDSFYYKYVVSVEDRILKRCDIIFVTAIKLKNMLLERKPDIKILELVRNAFGNQIIVPEVKNEKKADKTFRVGYVGVISSWFDYDSILYCVENIENLEFNLVGPLNTNLNLKPHDRIKFIGTVHNEDLYNQMKINDCVIMPFKLDELILTVDPVKLYEYLNYNLPIYSIYYDEISRFEPFIYFYNNKEDLCNMLKDASLNGLQKKYTDNQRIEFLNENTWKCRGQQIITVFKSLGL